MPAGIATWTLLPSIATSDLNIYRKKKKNFYIDFIKKLQGAPIIIIAIVLFIGFLPCIKFLKQITIYIQKDLKFEKNDCKLIICC